MIKNNLKVLKLLTKPSSRLFSSSSRPSVDKIPSMKDFMKDANPNTKEQDFVQEDDSQLPDYLQIERVKNRQLDKTYFIETYGC